MRYAVLISPGHNRVYYLESLSMAEYEFSVLADSMDAVVEDLGVETIAGVDYLCFSAEPLSSRDIAILSRLSFVLALYEVRGDGGETVLVPFERARLSAVDGSIGSMLKYKGKTNETFTRMLINLAQYSSDFVFTENLMLLDPMCGKGTTLFEAAAFGLNACGMEIAGKPVEEAQRFFRKYLEEARFKFDLKADSVGIDKQKHPRWRFCYGETKEKLKSAPKTLELVSGRAEDAAAFHKKNSVHLLVADLPYGVQHTGITGDKSAAAGDSNALLESCLPVFYDLLKKGGAAAVSFNLYRSRRAEVAAMFESAGFSVCDGGPYLRFAHRVEQAIRRDVVVARK